MSATNSIPVRSQFETAPLFVDRVIVNSQSKKIILKLPDNIGTFSIRAYAVNEETLFGSKEIDVISRKELNLQPLLPRISRAGDQFEAGVTVYSDDPNFDGFVSVEANTIGTGIQLIQGQMIKQVQLMGNTPVAVRFPMTAIEFGESTLQFMAQADNSGTDGVEDQIPVLGVQDSVFVASSMAINASSQLWTHWMEGVSFPPAVPGSGTVILTAGVGRYPTIQLIAKTLVKPKYVDEPQKGRCTRWRNADVSITQIVLHQIISNYQLDQNQGQKTKKGNLPIEQQLADLQKEAINYLVEFTDKTWGLHWCDYYNYHLSVVNINLNVLALYLFSYANVIVPQSYSHIISTWEQVVETAIVEQVEVSIKNNSTWTNFGLLTKIFFIFGTDWEPSTTSQIVKDILSFDNLNKKELSLHDRLYLYLAIHKWSSYFYSSDRTIRRVLSQLRIQGRTAYIVSGNGRKDAAPIDLQSIALSVLAKSGSQHAGVEKLANYLAQSNIKSVRDSAFIAIALQDYDSTRANNKPNLSFKAKSSDFLIADGQFKSASDPPIKNITPWSDLPTMLLGKGSSTELKPNPIGFYVKGSGEISVAIGLDFVPSTISTDPIYRGIYVEKVIQHLDPLTQHGSGGSIYATSIKNTLEITIQITTPDDLQNVELVDLVPGGLEPIDPNIGGGILPSWWTTFRRQETKSDRVSWEADFVRAGTHSVSYQAVAVTPGNWSLPPAKAESQKQPEVMGLSGGGHFLVTLTDVFLDLHIKEVIQPESCSQICSSEQYCNLKTQKCQNQVENIIIAFSPPVSTEPPKSEKLNVELQKLPHPINFDVVSNHENHLELQWDQSEGIHWDLSTPIQHYVVQYRPLIGRFQWTTPAGGRKVTGNSFLLLMSKLQPNRTYKFRIKAVGQNKSSSRWALAKYHLKTRN